MNRLNKKADLQQWLMSLLVFSVIIITGTLAITDVRDTYDSVNDTRSEFEEVKNQSEQILNETEQTSRTQKNKTLAGEVDADNTEDSMFSGAFKSIRLIKNSFGLVQSVIYTVSTTIGIPSFLTTAALTAVIIFLVFATIRLIFRVVG